MPMYEYRCEDCGAKFERLSWKAADAAGAAAAPRCGCGSSRVERIWFSRVAVGGRSEAEGDFGDSGGEGCGAEGGCCGGGACQVN